MLLRACVQVLTSIIGLDADGYNPMRLCTAYWFVPSVIEADPLYFRGSVVLDQVRR